MSNKAYWPAYLAPLVNKNSSPDQIDLLPVGRVTNINLGLCSLLSIGLVVSLMSE